MQAYVCYNNLWWLFFFPQFSGQSRRVIAASESIAVNQSGEDNQGTYECKVYWHLAAIFIATPPLVLILGTVANVSSEVPLYNCLFLLATGSEDEAPTVKRQKLS